MATPKKQNLMDRMEEATVEINRKLEEARKKQTSKSPSKRDPGYSKATKAKLDKIGLSGKVSQPESVLNALDQLPDAQIERLLEVRQQDATEKGERSTRAAMVQQVHPAIGMLSRPAQEGWLEYAELWDAAQPALSMQYGEKVSAKSSVRDETRDPAWLDKAKRLREFHATLDLRITRKADEFMRTKETIAVNNLVLSMLEHVGKRLARAFEAWG